MGCCVRSGEHGGCGRPHPIELPPDCFPSDLPWEQVVVLPPGALEGPAAAQWTALLRRHAARGRAAAAAPGTAEAAPPSPRPAAAVQQAATVGSAAGAWYGEWLCGRGAVNGAEHGCKACRAKALCRLVLMPQFALALGCLTRPRFPALPAGQHSCGLTNALAAYLGCTLVSQCLMLTLLGGACRHWMATGRCPHPSCRHRHPVNPLPPEATTMQPERTFPPGQDAACTAEGEDPEFLELLRGLGVAPPALAAAGGCAAGAGAAEGAAAAEGLLAALAGIQLAGDDPAAVAVAEAGGEEEWCLVCQEGSRDTLLLPCNHAALCAFCCSCLFAT